MKTTLTALLAICLCLPLMGDDPAKKFFEETKAKAEKGDKIAQNYLGVMYDNGEGVPEDDKEAVKWYRKAAEQGNRFGQYSLGVMCARGEGVLGDYATAYVWTNIAAANGHKTAPKFKSEFLEKKMTADQIAKAQELSREMIKKNPKLIQKKK